MLRPAARRRSTSVTSIMDSSRRTWVPPDGDQRRRRQKPSHCSVARPAPGCMTLQNVRVAGCMPLQTLGQPLMLVAASCCKCGGCMTLRNVPPGGCMRLQTGIERPPCSVWAISQRRPRCARARPAGMQIGLDDQPVDAVWASRREAFRMPPRTQCATTRSGCNASIFDVGPRSPDREWPREGEPFCSIAPNEPWLRRRSLFFTPNKIC